MMPARWVAQLAGERIQVPICTRMYVWEVGIRIPYLVAAGPVVLFLLERIRTALDHITEEPNGHSSDGHCR